MSAKFTYYGGMAVKIERYDGYKILVDPYINNNPHTSMCAHDFYDMDLILSTHAANDHFGDCAEIFMNSKALLMAGRACKKRLVDANAMDETRYINTVYGDIRRFGCTTVRTVYAAHGSIVNDPNNSNFYSAPPFGFIIEIEPNVVYYHAGDTALYGDMRLIRELYHPDIMAVGIDRIRLDASCEMTSREAAYAVSWAGAHVVIPTHYAPKSTAPKEFVRHLETVAPHVIVKSEIEKAFTYVPFRVE